MKKTIALIIILIMILSLTGCAEINYEVEVNKDGSGEISYIYGISKEQAGNMLEIVEEAAEAMKTQAEESGYTVEAYEDDELSGFKANKHLENLGKEFSLEEAFGKEYVKDTEENKIIVEKSFWTTSYSQTAELNLTNYSDSNIEMIYKIKIPTKVKENNADIISDNGKELTWNLKAGEINQIKFMAEEINTLPIIIIASTVIVVAVVLAVTLIILKKKRVTKKEN